MYICSAALATFQHEYDNGVPGSFVFLPDRLTDIFYCPRCLTELFTALPNSTRTVTLSPNSCHCNIVHVL